MRSEDPLHFIDAALRCFTTKLEIPGLHCDWKEGRKRRKERKERKEENDEVIEVRVVPQDMEDRLLKGRGD